MEFHRGTCPQHPGFSSRVCCDESARLHVYIIYIIMYIWIWWWRSSSFSFSLVFIAQLPVITFLGLTINHHNHPYASIICPDFLPETPNAAPRASPHFQLNSILTWPPPTPKCSEPARYASVLPPRRKGVSCGHVVDTPENEHRTQTCRFGRWSFYFQLGDFFWIPC